MRGTASAQLLGAALCAAVTGCEPSSIANVAIADWCVSMESAIRDRHLLCGCPGAPATDDAIQTRCAALHAESLLALYDDDAIGWNGAVADARVRAIDGCDESDDSWLDDPVIGSVPVGAPCRRFEDVWGQPDDCVHGAHCVVALGSPPGGGSTCVELVGQGESCEGPRACEPGLVCGADLTCAAAPVVPPGDGALGEACSSDAECDDASCVAGVCAAPACSET